MTHMDDDIVSLLSKRAYDLAGISKVKVMLNGHRIEVKDFQSYCDLYLKNAENSDLPKITEVKHPRWEITASLSDGQFQQVSFVNSICTSKGGTHVNYIVDQIVGKLQTVLQKKNKKLVIKPHQIRANLWIFVNCLVENPAFDSQTKETLATKAVDFGSTVELTEKFLKGILDSGVVESILSVAKAKEDAKMARQLGPGKKKAKLLGIPKLEDANNAGTRNAEACTIILTEGDSAKSLALAGIEIVGRDKYGVFPLRGKFLNVRDAANK
jgi:DNA topoisomerase-2